MGLYIALPANILLTANSTQTLLQITAGSANQFKLIEFGISFDGSTASAPIEVDLLRQTSAGTGGSSVTPKQWGDPSDGTPNATALKGTFSGEPTSGDFAGIWRVANNNGLFAMQYPLGREPRVGPSGRIALRTTTPAGIAPNCLLYMVWDESA